MLGFVQDDAARPGTAAVLAELAAAGVAGVAAGSGGGGVAQLPTVPRGTPTPTCCRCWSASISRWKQRRSRPAATRTIRRACKRSLGRRDAP